MSTKSVDPAVFDLAFRWLSDYSQSPSHERTMRLAQDVQQTLEDFIEDEAREAEGRDDEQRSLRGYDAQDIAEKF